MVSGSVSPSCIDGNANYWTLIVYIENDYGQHEIQNRDMRRLQVSWTFPDSDFPTALRGVCVDRAYLVTLVGYLSPSLSITS